MSIDYCSSAVLIVETDKLEFTSCDREQVSFVLRQIGRVASQIPAETAKQFPGQPRAGMVAKQLRTLISYSRAVS